MSAATDRLIAVMARLRDPQHGCPWDIEQSFASIAPYTIEEAYEVADAIEQGDIAGLKGELGDLLLQVVFHARMAEEIGAFTFEAVAEGIAEKMIRRHPHVFADAAVDGAGGTIAVWEEQKAEERAAAAAAEGRPVSVLDGVAKGLPALLRAVKLQKRASRVGFDWAAAGPVMAKIAEEIGELQAEMAAPAPDPARLADELGDVLFCIANLARFLEIDPEAALRGCNAKFERRFRRVEALLAKDGRRPETASLDEMEALWQRAKEEERRTTE
ncbi:MAG: nucleoside triphosphate pyrophosphohydrolase [Thalassobaculales bacterium]